MLTRRQELLLSKVVEGFQATGQPVGSKALAADPDVTAGPSTIRNELAVLEELGLLAHPHTSAGRVPTDAGHRYYVDRLLPVPASGSGELRLELVRREVDEAMRVTTEATHEETSERGGLTFYVFTTRSVNQRGETVCEGRWTNIVR